MHRDATGMNPAAYDIALVESKRLRAALQAVEQRIAMYERSQQAGWTTDEQRTLGESALLELRAEAEGYRAELLRRSEPAPEAPTVAAPVAERAVAPEPTDVRDGYVCGDCNAVVESDDAIDSPLYECCETFTRDDTDNGDNRCPQCNKFAAKVHSGPTCPECNEGELTADTLVTCSACGDVVLDVDWNDHATTCG